MDNLKKVKYLIIAAGIVISAVFYVKSGDSGFVKGYSGDKYIIGDELPEGPNDEGSEAAGAEADESAKSGAEGSEAAGNVKSGGNAGGTESFDKEGESDISGAVRAEFSGLIADYFDSGEYREEFKSLIRDAVREEIVSIAGEGYLEQAVSEAAEYAAEQAELKKGMVNINTAGKDELMTLDGIGEKRAGDIISYREQNGGFTSPEDIMNVSGIKESSYNKFKDKIYAE